MKRTFQYLALSAATALLMGSTTNSFGQTNCKNVPVHVALAAGPLAQGLTKFSHHIECKLIYKTSLVEKLKGNPVKGKYLPFNGLAELIKGTGLEVHPAKDGFELNQNDQDQIRIKAATLQAALGQAVKAQKVGQSAASIVFKQLGAIRTSVASLVKSQGFVSAAEKASFERTFRQARQTLSYSRK